MRGIFDTESNGLLSAMKDRKTGKVQPPMDHFHCAAWKNLDDGTELDWDPNNIEEAFRFLMDVEELWGHNIIGFDLKAIRRFYPWFKLSRHMKVRDSLVLAKLVWPADVLINLDMKLFHQGKLPAKYIKRYSLASFGCRFGEEKAEYTGGWDEWSPEMHDYMIQDVRANEPLVRKLMYRLGWTEKAKEDGIYEWPELPIEIENGAADIVSDQELCGVGFDQAKAQALCQQLTNRQAELGETLKEVFGSWWQPLDNPEKGRRPAKDRNVKLPQFPDVTIPRVGKTGKALKPYVGPPIESYSTDAPYVRIQRVEFNPASRKHLGDRLKRVFGWEPVIYTENGQAQVDEGVIKTLPSEVIDAATRDTILEYFVVSKTLGMLAGGKTAWMSCIADHDARIHGRCDPLGTVTTRAAHYNPNLGQAPSVEVDAEKKPIKGIRGGFGWEMRDLFIPVTPGSPQSFQREDDEMSGTDMSSLEFILLGHDLYPLDEGVFSDRVSDPNRDPHAEHSELTGLNRANTKNVGYAYIFGGGDEKIGVMVGVTDAEIKDLLKYKGLMMKLRWRKKILGVKYKEPTDREKATLAKGAIVKKKFEDAITGLKYLKDDMTATAKERGWIKSISGAKIITRKPHAALNTRLQGGGATACKLWDIITNMMLGDGTIGIPLPLIEAATKDLKREGLARGIDFYQMLWVHDELQFGHRKGLGPIIKRVSNEAAARTGEILGLRGKFRTDTKTGPSWAWTH